MSFRICMYDVCLVVCRNSTINAADPLTPDMRTVESIQNLGCPLKNIDDDDYLLRVIENR